MPTKIKMLARNTSDRLSSATRNIKMLTCFCHGARVAPYQIGPAQVLRRSLQALSVLTMTRNIKMLTLTIPGPLQRARLPVSLQPLSRRLEKRGVPRRRRSPAFDISCYDISLRSCPATLRATVNQLLLSSLEYCTHLSLLGM